MTIANGKVSRVRSELSKVGEYQLLSLLGSGGMGDVYFGVSPTADPVAVKVIRPHLVTGHRYAVWTVDTTITQPGRAGVGAEVAAGNTTVAATVAVDDIQARRPLADVDIRLQLRTSADQWAVSVQHRSYTAPGRIASGWGMDLNDVQTCFQVFGSGLFGGCVATSDIGVVRQQRRWVRVTYDQRVGDGLATMNLLTSLDGANWTLVRSLRDYPEPLDADTGFFSILLNGGVTVSRVEVRDGIDGALITAPDFQAQPKGTTALVDARGVVWEVDGRGICATA